MKSHEDLKHMTNLWGSPGTHTAEAQRTWMLEERTGLDSRAPCSRTWKFPLGDEEHGSFRPVSDMVRLAFRKIALVEL